jgi:hypothetical protein
MSKRLFLAAIAATGILAAQDPPSLIGRLSYLQGSVSFQPGGVDEWVPASLNRPLTSGDQIFSDEGARAEIHVPGAAFLLGSRTAFQFLNLDDRNVQVKLSEGPMIVRVREMEAGNVEIDTPNVAFTISAPGEYRIDTYPDSSETYVTVRSGEGQAIGNGGSFTLHAREQVVVSGQDQSSQYQVYDAPGLDAFDEWAMSRERRSDRRPSSRYVSPYVVGAEDLDDYGDWRPNPEYGQVWIPRAMPAGWAPYQYGHWAWIDPWGWTWVDDAPWGFAPFHYGRWANFDGNWGWVPSPFRARPIYAPALVAWIGGGGFSVGLRVGGASVGWFPLSPRDVYIPAYRASPTYVTQVNVTNTTVINNTSVTNVYNNYVQTGNVSVTNYANRSVPGAVAVVPQSTLASARPVQQAVTRVQPNQVSMISTAESAPRVAPQVASVLGRPAAAGANVPRPPAAVTSRAVVAKSAPPPPPPPFQERSARLAQDPGRPIPIQEQRQITRTAPAAVAPPVHVVTQAPAIAPAVNRAPAPPPGTFAQRPVVPGAQPQLAQPQAPARVQAQPARPAYEPPSAQPQARPIEPQPARPANQPPVQQPQARPIEPQPARPANQPPVQQPQARPIEPQPARPAYQPPAQQPQARPVEPQRPANQPPVQQPQARPVEPAQRPANQPPVQQPQARPVEPAPSRPAYQPPVQQPQARPVEPQRPAREAAPPPPPQQQPRSYEPPAAQRRPVEPQVRPPLVVHGQQPESERRVQPPPPERRAEPPQRRPAPPPKDEKKDEKK